MSRRLDQEREARLQPQRMQAALTKIAELGYPTKQVDETRLEFVFNGNKISYWPYSGWASGKGIKDGRGLENLLQQLPKKQH